MDSNIIMRMLAEDEQTPVILAARTEWQAYIESIAAGTPVQAASAEMSNQIALAQQRALAAINPVTTAMMAQEGAENRLNLAKAQAAVAQERLEAAQTKGKASAAQLELLEAQAAVAVDRVAVAEDMLAASTDRVGLAQARAAVAADAFQASLTKVAESEVVAAEAAEVETVALTTQGRAAMSAAERMLFLYTGAAAGQRDMAGMSAGLAGVTGSSFAMAAGLFVAGAAIIGVTKSSMDWQTQMVLLQNNTNATDETMRAMSSAILDTSAAVGANADNMAIGARHIMDYGFAGAEAINILNESTKLAVATGADEAHISQTVSQALHQYGESGDQAAKYINILYAESLRANSTVEQFGTSIFRVTGLAANVGVPFDQATAAVSALTRELGNSAQAQTQVLNVMRFILKPTADEADAWDSLSKRSGDLTINSKNLANTLAEEGLTGVLHRTRDAMDKLGMSQVEMAKESFDLINAQRGGMGMFVLLTGAMKDYDGGIAAAKTANDGIGASQEALNRKLETGQGKWDQLGAAIHRATAEGSAFDTVAGGIADELNAKLQRAGILLDVLGKPIGSLAFNEDVKKYSMNLKELEAYEKAAADQGVYFGSVAADVSRTIATETNTLDKEKIAAAAAAKAQADLATQTELLHKAFAGLANIKDMGGTQAMVRQMTDSLDQLQKVFGEKGAQAAGDYAQKLLDRFQSLPPETRAALDPILSILQDFVTSAGTSGDDAGNAWGDHFHGGLEAWQHDIQDQFDQYATAADMRSLFQKLGIETGDNYAANVHDRVAAWFEPFKAQLMAYLQAVEVTANAAMQRMRDSAHMIAGLAKAMGGIPGMEGVFEGKAEALNKAASQYAAGTVNTIQSAISQLNGIKASVDAQAAAAITDHNDKAAKKGKGGGTDPAHADVTGDKRNESVDDATVKLAALVAEAKLRAERDDLAKATTNLTHTQDLWNGLLKDEQDTIKKGASDHKEGMKATELSIKMATKALDEMKAHHEAAQHDMSEQIYKLTNDMKPYEAELEKVAAWLKHLQELGREMDESFATEAHGPEMALQGMEHEAQNLADKLRDVEDAERAAMAGADAHVAAEQATLDAEQARMDKLQARMTELNEMQAKNQRTDKLHDEGNAIENLTARLKNQNLTAQERAALEEQLAKARRDMGIDQEKDGLQDRIDKEQKIVAQKQEAVKAAEKERSELQKLYAQQKENIRAEQEALDKRKEIASNELRDIRERQAEFDYEQHQKEAAAQKDVDRAQTQVDIRQKEIDKLQAKLAQEQHNDSEEERLAGLNLDRLNEEKQKRDDNYDAWVEQENDKLAKLQTNSDAAVKSAQDTVTKLQGILDNDTKSKDDRDFFSKLKDGVDNLKLALETADLPIKVKGVGDVTSGLSDSARNAATNAIALANALLSNLNPAMGALKSTTDTQLGGVSTAWDALFAVNGSDPKNIHNKLFKHSDAGFFTNMDNKTIIAMNFSKGVWNGKLVELANTVIDGNLVPMAAAAGLKAGDVGAAIDGGIATQITDHKGEIAAALIAALDDAFTAAKNHIEAKSPAQKPGREIGYPIPQGVAEYITRGAPLVNDAMRGMMGGAIGSVGIPGGGIGVPASAWGGGGNVTHNHGPIQVHLPQGMTSLPTDPMAWLPSMHALEAAQTIYDRQG